MPLDELSLRARLSAKDANQQTANQTAVFELARCSDTWPTVRSKASFGCQNWSRLVIWLLGLRSTSTLLSRFVCGEQSATCLKTDSNQNEQPRRDKFIIWKRIKALSQVQDVA